MMEYDKHLTVICIITQLFYILKCISKCRVQHGGHFSYIYDMSLVDTLMKCRTFLIMVTNCDKRPCLILDMCYFNSFIINYTPRTTKLLGGILVSLRPSVCPSVCPSVRPSVCPGCPCPLCNIYSSGWILSILATNDHYHERVCRTQWPLTLTYIFKVIRPWLRKSCPLCTVYSSGWILFIFGTNDHYYSGGVARYVFSKSENLNF